MKREQNLFEKIVSFENLLKASNKAFRGKKGQEAISRFYFYLEYELLRLKQDLTTGSYEPRDYRIFEIREPKIRKICSSAFRDRITHHAICNYLEPIFEKRLIFDSYACRAGKGMHAAIKRCQFFAQRNAYYLKCDVRKYFENIDHVILKRLLRRLIKDKRLLGLLDRIIDHPVPGNAFEKGLPIGNLTSQHFANLYLGELDHFLKDRLQVKSYIRYMDDSLIFSSDKDKLSLYLGSIRKFLADELKLELKEKVTRIAPVSEGVPFLGFRIFPKLIRLQRVNLVRYRRKIKTREKQYELGQLDETKFIQSIGSLIAHISHANTLSLRRKEFHGINSL